jgi:hypothetical protein
VIPPETTVISYFPFLFPKTPTKPHAQSMHARSPSPVTSLRVFRRHKRARSCIKLPASNGHDQDGTTAAGISEASQDVRSSTRSPLRFLVLRGKSRKKTTHIPRTTPGQGGRDRVK